MRIVFNSDVVWSTWRDLNTLPEPVETLLREAAEAGAIAVIPRPSLLEYSRRQGEVRAQDMKGVEEAAALLRGHGITMRAFDVSALFTIVPLDAIVKGTGIRVEVENPTHEDYINAERKACMHLPPCPATSAGNSDEMRDLVIWEVAIRVAKRDAGAILYSMDKVHGGKAGAAEADANELLRASNVDQVREFLGRHGPTASRATQLIAPFWPELQRKGFAVPNDVQFTSVRKPRFQIVDLRGHFAGRFSFRAKTDGGTLEAVVDVAQESPATVRLTMSNIVIGGKPRDSLSIILSGELPIDTASPGADALADLRKTLEGK